MLRPATGQDIFVLDIPVFDMTCKSAAVLAKGVDEGVALTPLAVV